MLRRSPSVTTPPATGRRPRLSEAAVLVRIAPGVVAQQLLALSDCLVMLAKVAVEVGTHGSPPPVIALGFEQGRQCDDGGVRVIALQRNEHFDCRVGRVLLVESVSIGDDWSQRRQVDVPSGGRVVHFAEGTSGRSQTIVHAVAWGRCRTRRTTTERRWRRCRG